MSRLHEWIKKHEGLDAEEKESCNCGMCQGTNVHGYQSKKKKK